MPNEPKLLRKELDAMRHAYAAQLPEKIRQVESAWARLGNGSPDPRAAGELLRLAHNLASSGSVFGFHAVSEAAHSLEQSLNHLGETPRAPTPAEHQTLHVHLERLNLAARHAESGRVNLAE